MRGELSDWITLKEAARRSRLPKDRLLILALEGIVDARMHDGREEISREDLLYWLNRYRTEIAPNGLIFNSQPASVSEVEAACVEVREENRKREIAHIIHRLSTRSAQGTAGTTP